jgi:FkbM family methyltransferase
MEKIDFRDLLVDVKDPMIVQIGSHDGILGEEYGLQEYLEKIKNFSLILVEPIKEYFDKLPQVYGKYDKQIKYCNYAISDVEGQVYMKEQGCMSKIDQNGTLPVFSKTWNSFLLQNYIKKIDLLLLDCEGYEFEILKNINFNIIKPKVIRYEYYWIENKAECDNLLFKNGYKIDYCLHDHTYNKVAYL